MISGSSLPRLHALTGLRFFAAAWVVCYHFRSDVKTLFPVTRPAWPFLDAGYSGVDIFFILSGFIISYTYLETFGHWSAAGHLKFLWLRLARIYPVHLATLAFFLLYNQPGTVGDLSLTKILTAMRLSEFREQLLLTHAWGVGETRSWNYPAWSISVEWIAYLAFPVLAVGLIHLRRERPALVGLLASLLLNLAIFLAIAAAGHDGEIPMLRIVGEFLAGVCLYRLWTHGWPRRLNWTFATPAFAFAGIATTVVVAHWSDSAPILAAPFYALTILGLGYGRDGISSLLATRPVVYLGEASYSLYMTHAVSQAWLWNNFPVGDATSSGRLERLLLLVFYFVVISLVALVTYHLIERPGRRLMRRALTGWGKSNKGASAAQPAPAQGAQ